ncbi:hypothetical protein EDD21DRAFT_91979 [Dissophora ornata]|nr:hypothetical protein EDD21DRAFT_91979 [Dissophora ornata]
MDSDIPTSWVRVIVAQKISRLDADNVVREEIFVLRGGHLIELLPERAPSSGRVHEYFSDIQVGDQIEIKGRLLIEQGNRGELKTSLITKQKMRIIQYTNSQQDIVGSTESDTDQEVLSFSLTLVSSFDCLAYWTCFKDEESESDDYSEYTGSSDSQEARGSSCESNAAGQDQDTGGNNDCTGDSYNEDESVTQGKVVIYKRPHGTENLRTSNPKRSKSSSSILDQNSRGEGSSSLRRLPPPHTARFYALISENYNRMHNHARSSSVRRQRRS